ncbi:hypothetical protein EV715DRAFT_210067 [Schizophyllum commune]
MQSHERSPSIEIVSVGAPSHPRKTALMESTRTANNQSPSGTGAWTKGLKAPIMKEHKEHAHTTAASIQAKPAAATMSGAKEPEPSVSAGSKRKSLDAPPSSAKRAKTNAAPKESKARKTEENKAKVTEQKKAKVEEKKDAAERWKWIDRRRPEIEMKGTSIEAFNCGGTFFKSSAKHVADRLDKLEAFLAECDGDERYHPMYGDWESYKAKRVTRKKGEPEDTRWQWIDRRKPEMRFKGTKIEAYNCGGAFWKATGKTIADRLDKMEPLRSAPIVLRRTLHVSAPVLRKKSKGKTTVFEDEFSFEESGESLFADAGAESAMEGLKDEASTAPAEDKRNEHVANTNKLSPEARQQRFDELYNFVKPRIGRRPIHSKEQVRRSAWNHLIQLATKPEQLEQVVELLPAWKDSGREINATISELFIRRCHELQSPALAVKVFGDFGRYGVPLTLEGGRTLLYSLLLHDSIPNIVAVTTLYKVYDLPPLASDLVSCSILVAACHKHGDVDAQVVAETLTPFLKDLVAKGGEAGRGKHPEEQYEKWLSWALFQVHQARVQAEQPSYPWLEKWRNVWETKGIVDPVTKEPVQAAA